MSGQGLVTAEQLLGIAEPGFRFEVVRGELRRMSAAGYMHGVVTGRITLRLGSWVEGHGLGVICGAETGFVLERDPDTVQAPDVAFVTGERHVDAAGFFPGPPDLAVEVVSPGDSFSAVQSKGLDWIAHGATSVWVVDPSQETVTTYGAAESRVLRGDDVLVDAAVLPGFEQRVAEFFVSS